MRATFAKFVTAVLGAGMMMTATAALACNTGCAPPAPPTRPTPPSTPSMPSNCGCDTSGGGGGSWSHSGSSTSVNVNVQTQTSASSAASVFSFGSGSDYSSSGGYGNWSQTPGPVENAGAMNIETGANAAAFDMITDRRSVTRTIVIQASCIDDTGVPHPASQLGPDRAIANDYVGEVYRCIAGTHMQVTMADLGICDDFGGAGEARVSESESASYSHSETYSDSGYSSQGGYAQGGYAQGGYAQGGYGAPMPTNPCSPQALACSGAPGAVMAAPHRAGCAANAAFSHVNFDGGQMMTCQKGDALWFERGNMTCKVQIPQRQCNERSLLRRFGAGIKVLTITRVETTQRQVARQVERASSTTTVMTFNGGVGGFVE